MQYINLYNSSAPYIAAYIELCFCINTFLKKNI
jgi:hypothetical protein